MHIKKIIFYTIFEIISLSVMLFTTYILWSSFEIEKTAKIAYSFAHDENQISLETKGKINNLKIISDNTWKNYNDGIELKIHNKSQINKKYNLYLIIKANSTIDKKYLKFSLGKEPLKIYMLENFKFEENTYYLLKSDEIKSGQIFKETLFIWFDIKTPLSEKEKKFSYEIKLEEISCFN